MANFALQKSQIMKFRTEIEPLKGSFTLDHSDRIVLLGSCFADSIGEQLRLDGFDVTVNPMGPLYNPISLAHVFDLKRLLIACDGDNYHCLDFASRYTAPELDELETMVHADLDPLREAINHATAIIITFGSARVYRSYALRQIVGNCHRLPAADFAVELLTVDQIVDRWRSLLPPGKKVIFTVSPIRYVADGLSNNSLSKAILRVAVDQITALNGADYFPSFEILNDDLRDYRFYTADLKHPSDQAVDYVYEHFARTYFSAATAEEAARRRRLAMQSRHIPNFHRQ